MQWYNDVKGYLIVIIQGMVFHMVFELEIATLHIYCRIHFVYGGTIKNQLFMWVFFIPVP